MSTPTKYSKPYSQREAALFAYGCGKSGLYGFENPPAGMLTYFVVVDNEIHITEQDPLPGCPVESQEAAKASILEFMDIESILKLSPECI